MKPSKLVTNVIILFLSIQINAAAHEMQHGFILSNNDTLGSHLVANGPHSRQVEINGKLSVRNPSELAFYQQRKENSTMNQSYFVFQAQQLDLPSLSDGGILTGHIIESKIGSYDPKNIIVKSATFQVQKVLLNLPNPFFGNQIQRCLFSLPHSFDWQNGIHIDKPLVEFNSQIRNCCDTGEKPCNWKC